MEKTIEIPEGYEARIEGNKVILESKESENEEIRKVLINIVKGACDKYGIKYHGDEITEEKLLAWLEKQGKQNLANSEKTCKDEQNPAWSEEDERIKQDIENLIHFALRDGSAVSPAADTTKENALDWLKSLKNRCTWKPSDGQMQALEFVVQYHAFGNTDNREKIVALFNDLKKLKR